MSRGTRRGTRTKRRGDMFMFGLDILFLCAIILIFWRLSVAFSHVNADEGLGTRQTAVLATYATSEKMLFYLDEAAKFSAFEAYVNTFGAGGRIENSPTPCGQYIAGYYLWTLQGKDCFPSKHETTKATDQKKQEETVARFRTELAAAFARTMRYPGLPLPQYQYDVYGDDVIYVDGMAQGKIRLPIVTAKDATQAKAAGIIEQENLVRTQGGGAIPDPAIPGVQMIISPNRRTRDAAPATILITASGTQDALAANSQYVDGVIAAHYLVDQQGAITQYVPEDQAVYSGIDCDASPCALGGAPATSGKLEQDSIIISLVNAGPSSPKNGKCNAGDELMARTDWCAAGAFSAITATCTGASYAKQCWPSYQKPQLDALKKLVDDIVSRREIKPANIKIEEQVRPASFLPGPALHEQSKTQNDYLASLIIGKPEFVGPPRPSDIPEEGQESGDATLTDSRLPLDWPVESKVITSCYGTRELLGRREHLGIDLRAKEGDKVNAVADGTVFLLDDCDPKNCGTSGKNIIIKHTDTFYTRYSHLSGVSITKLDADGRPTVVLRGQEIGKAGNTGSSEAAHLDFKVYRGSPNTNKAVNPLCIFPEELLQDKSFSDTAQTCKDNYKGATKPSRSDPTLLQECQSSGVTPHPSIPACAINQFDLEAVSDRDLSVTLDRLGPKQQNLLMEIDDAAKQEGLDGTKGLPDSRIIIALITQESKGDPTVVSPSGCAGLGQFCLGTADKGDFAKIFGGGFRKCSCTTKPCTADNSGCAGDPRFDAHKSVLAIARHIRSDLNTNAFVGKKDRLLFAIASYNAGAGLINAGIKATGKPDPSWAEVAGAITPAMVNNLYCDGGKKQNCYFSTPERQAGKIVEVTNYVKRVSAYYAKLGGVVATTYTDQQCDQVTLKEMGSYAFSPSFSVELPNLFTSMDKVASFAKETYTLCDGKDGGDNRKCFETEKSKFGVGSLSIVQCDDARTAVLTSLAEAVRDCKDNLQESCACAWTPPSTLSASKVVVDGAGDAFKVTIDGTEILVPGSVAPAPSAVQYQDTPSAAVESKFVKYTFNYQDTQLRERTLSVGDGKTSKDTTVGGILFYKNGDALTWLGRKNDPGEVTDTCGAYKTMQRVCVGLKQPLYVMSKGEFVNPIIRFALDLQDNAAPVAVDGLTVNATKEPGKLVVEFPASTSEDISYYRVFCSLTPKFADGHDMIQLGRMQDVPIRGVITAKLSQCDGAIMPDGQYYVKLVPVDLSGNEGAETVYDPTKEALQAALTG